MDTGRSRYGEGDLLAVPALREDGATISVEFTIVPLREADGTILGLAAVVRDVSKRFDELRASRRRIAELEAAARRP
jgi:PAS domain S-box-containing protein